MSHDLPDDWYEDHDGQRLVLNAGKVHAEIERLKGEVVKWQIEAGKFGAGCPACDDLGEENERLRAALAEVTDIAQREVHDLPSEEFWEKIGRAEAILNEQYAATEEAK